MKIKHLFFFAAVVLMAACNKPEPTPDPKPDDKPKEKAFAVSPESITVEADATSASITVTGEVAWTVTSDNNAVSVSPAAGTGNGTIAVSFAANETENEVKANLEVFTTDELAKVKSYKIPFTQKGKAHVEPDPEPDPDPQPSVKDTTYLARWWFDASQVDVLKAHFHEEAKIDGATNVEACKPGNGGYYIEPNVSGSGRIEFYNGVDKTEINPKGRVKRVIGQWGGVVSYGTWKGDYYLLTANTEAALAAGTDIYTFFALRPNVANVPKYWMVEINDGGSWKPYLETKKVTVEGEGEVEYNLELVYEADGTPKCHDTIVDSEYKLTAATKDIQIRILAVSGAYAEGAGLPTNIGDGPAKAQQGNPVTILVGNRLADTGLPVEHHTMICVVK